VTLQYVIGDYVSVSGKRLEGNGVQPDEVVTLNREALLAAATPPWMPRFGGFARRAATRQKQQHGVAK